MSFQINSESQGFWGFVFLLDKLHAAILFIYFCLFFCMSYNNSPSASLAVTLKNRFTDKEISTDYSSVQGGVDND